MIALQFRRQFDRVIVVGLLSLKNGYIVGIVTQYANSTDTVSADKEGFRDNHSIPFYNAIASTGIIQILSELDNTIPIIFEDYQ